MEMIEPICWGESVGFFCSNMATAPETWGAAKLVPLVRLYTPAIEVVFTKTPGATRFGFM